MFAALQTKWVLGSIFMIALSLALVCAHAESVSGKQVFDTWCNACHLDSPFAPGTIQLKQTRGPDHAIVERRTDLTEELIRVLVRQGLAGMPKFRRTEINNVELDALVEYLVKR